MCIESFDSKLVNIHTKFFCEKAFDILEKALIDETYENLAYGAMISGLGFGNSSTTLGHALSFTTSIAHQFNNSKFYDRFKFLVNKLDFKPIKLKQNIVKSIQTDRKHLDHNPKNVSNDDVVKLLKLINSNN